MRPLGLFLTFATFLVVIVESLRHERTRLPAYGWLGLVVLIAAEGLMFRDICPINVYFTPIAWTAYLLIADALVVTITGHSRLHDAPRNFLLSALLSIPLWTIFEAYNLRLANWTYVGVPISWPAALLGYAWSFATIIPAILETA